LSTQLWVLKLKIETIAFILTLIRLVSTSQIDCKLYLSHYRYIIYGINIRSIRFILGIKTSITILFQFSFDFAIECRYRICDFVYRIFDKKIIQVFWTSQRSTRDYVCFLFIQAYYFMIHIFVSKFFPLLFFLVLRYIKNSSNSSIHLIQVLQFSRIYFFLEYIYLFEK